MGHADSRVEAAYAACRRVARRHYENFPVASHLVPRDKRDALAAIYAFARCADDFADEGVKGAVKPEARLEQLADWRQKLQDCYRGQADDPVFVALSDAAHRHQLSRQHFEDLLRAFALDVNVNRHRNLPSLLTYCSCSANPVGRLVLELFGHDDVALVGLSDDICTALQFTNFWQDIAVDLERDRVYLPLEDLARFEYSLDDLRAARVDERWRRLLAFELARTREMFARGRSLVELVTPSLRLQLRLTWLGGMRILDKIEEAEYDVFRRRPALGRLDFLGLLLRAFRLRRGEWPNLNSWL
jgi:hydroxysqualene synthase